MNGEKTIHPSSTLNMHAITPNGLYLPEIKYPPTQTPWIITSLISQSDVSYQISHRHPYVKYIEQSSLYKWAN